MNTNIHEVLSPTALALAKTLGYGLIFVAWGIVILAGLRIIGEGRTSYNRFKNQRW